MDYLQNCVFCNVGANSLQIIYHWTHVRQTSKIVTITHFTDHWPIEKEKNLIFLFLTGYFFI